MDRWTEIELFVQTAELGSMKVTEQIDAMRALATSPVKKLVVPRVLAAASQLILVSPASQDAASALATTREWLEAHGHAALAEGAISGGDMTSVAALTKLMQVLGTIRGPAAIRRAMERSVAGERS